MKKTELEAKIDELKTISERQNERISQQKGLIDEQQKQINQQNAQINQQNAQINQHQEQIDKRDKQLGTFDEVVEATKNDIKEIKDFYYGKEDEDGERTGGIRAILSGLKKEMLSFWEDEEDSQSGNIKPGFMQDLENYWHGHEKEDGSRSGGKREYVENRIKYVEDLIGSATNKVLGEGYEKQSSFHEEKAKKYAGRFSAITVIALVILVIMFVTVLYLAPSNILFIELLNNKAYYAIVVSLIVSISGIIIWYGTFIKEKEREERIQYSEYAHKDQITKAFSGYLKTIQELDPENAKSGSPHLAKLYDEMLKSVGHNPSWRIKHKGSDHLSKYAIDRITLWNGKRKRDKGQKNNISDSDSNQTQ